MKEYYIKDLLNKGIGGSEVYTVYGWVNSIRRSKKHTFLDVCDSSGKIQIVASNDLVPENLKLEQSLMVEGLLRENRKKLRAEIEAHAIEIIGDVDKLLSPSPRSTFDIFDNKYVNYVQENRHLFIRNSKVMAALKARDLVKRAVHKWFYSQNFTEITAPILTPVLLYTEDTGISVNVNEQNLFLTQCVAFYLESAVHAFERVYNIGPSFRGAESISPRHLTEYWHVKAEIAFVTFEETFGIVEDLISSVARSVLDEGKELCSILGTKGAFEEALKVPFPRIRYDYAIRLCNENGIDVEFGKSLNSRAEAFLTEYFNSPVWVTHNPRTIEGFPYKICKDDNRLTYTADLIGSLGGGEILGIADKITDYDELTVRMEEKNKESNHGYDWFRELRNYGTVPHCGIGMGLERLIKWLFELPHVREAIPFPRSIGRKIYP
ncbi:MAG: hypothetical protein IKB27_03370 [Clostridia bacterium]|nr:hypothetical protein [Clostridia bacterium]